MSVNDQDRARYGRQFDEAFAEASRLAGSSLPPTDFYEQFLSRALSGIGAPAGAVWMRTPQGFLQVACQKNLEAIGLDDKRGGRQCHNEVLRHVFQASPPRPVLLEPQGRLAGITPEAGAAPAANLTDYYALFAPIVGPEKQSLGLLEVFQESSHEPRLYQTFLQYTLQMAGYASQYHNFAGTNKLGAAAGSEKVFAQIEAFARLIHSTLDPTEVAYHIANDGRRLIEVDRLCIGVRHGSKVTVEAVSGADVVEKASTHVRRLRNLFDEVLKFNDRLTFNGTRDDTLPPKVLHALDEYLAESQPKLLVVQPIRDEREKDETKPARSVALVECFNPPEQTEPIIQRMEVVLKHAAPALYNAAEMKRIPFKMLWWPVLKLQDGLGGKKKFYAVLIALGVALLTLAMVFVPYPMKMDAKGLFLPEQVKLVYAPIEGQVIELAARPGQKDIRPGTPLVKLLSNDYMAKLQEIDVKIGSFTRTREALQQQLKEAKAEQNTVDIQKQLSDAESQLEMLKKTRESMILNFSLIESEKGYFQAKAPQADRLNDISIGWLRDPSDFLAKGIKATDRLNGLDPGKWAVLSDDNRSQLVGRMVKPNEPLYRLGAIDGPWRGEIKIPQSNIGQVMHAYQTPGLHEVEELPDPANPANKITRKYLPVDVLFAGAPDTSYMGKLYEADVSAEAVPNKDDHNESAPVVMAYVRVDLSNLSPAERATIFVAGQEVRCKIRCGDRALGYSMFHGVWEWFYEKVIFFF